MTCKEYEIRVVEWSSKKGVDGEDGDDVEDKVKYVRSKDNNSQSLSGLVGRVYLVDIFLLRWLVIDIKLGNNN
jgi:hypothetical protein